MRPVMHDIEDGAHLVFADNLVQLGRVDGLTRGILKRGYVQLNHLAHLFLQGHSLEDFLYLGLDSLVGRNHRLNAVTACCKGCSRH